MMNFLRGLFFRPKTITDLRDGATIHRIGGHWGDRIEWTTPGSRVAGWKDPMPQAGDGIASEMKSGRTALYLITNIHPCGGPRDMFFADVVPLRYMDNGHA